MPVKIFFCYAHEDEALLNKLKTHLKPLKRQGLIDAWHDRDISAGTEWEMEIREHLNAAQIILLLISPDFMDSDYCYNKEMAWAIERHERDEVRVIPVILRPVAWQVSPFSKLKALPTNCKPVAMWRPHDAAFLEIVDGIRKVVTELALGLPQLFTDPSYTKETSQAIVPIGLPRPATLLGRDTEVNKLMSQLRAGVTTGIYALNGMGGVGKTALAAEVVAQLSLDHEAFPGGAAWIFCEGLVGSEGLDEILKRVAKAIKMKHLVVETDPEVRRDKLVEELTRSRLLLLALDNLEPQLDAEALLNTLAIPTHTTLLLTARHIVVPEKLTSIVLRPLSEIDASRLFVQRLKQVDSSRPREDESSEISTITAILGGLPLAIELAAAYAAVQGLPLAQILWELEQDKIEATALNFDSRRAILSRFNRSWTVLSLQEQRIFAGLSLLKGTVFPRAAALVIAFAVMKREIVDRQADITRQSQQKIAKLVDYALVEPIENDRLRLHPLLGEYADKQLSQLPSDLRYDLDNANRTFWQQYGQVYPDYEGLDVLEAQTLWEANQELAKETLKNQTTTTILSPSAHAKELQRLGLHLEKHGERKLAHARMTESLAIFQALRDVKEIGRCHLYLALSYEADSNDSDAFKHYCEALRFFKQAQSTDINTVRLKLSQLLQSISGEGGTTFPDASMIRAELRQYLQLDTVNTYAAPSGVKKRVIIRFVQGKGNKNIFEIHDQPVSIGRNQDSDIILGEDSLVSRKHATLTPLSEGTYGLRDEGSTNGTRLNGQITRLISYQIYPLKSGDTIHIGNTILTFIILGK